MVTMYFAVQMESADRFGPRSHAAITTRPASSTNLKEGIIKRSREKIAHTQGFGRAAWIHQEHFNVATKFPQNLPACSTRRRKTIRIRRHGDSAKFARPFGNRLEHRD